VKSSSRRTYSLEEKTASLLLMHLLYSNTSYVLIPIMRF
jgi:hypothetical protein